MLMTSCYPPACYADMYRGHVPAYTSAAPPLSTSTPQHSYQHNNNLTVGKIFIEAAFQNGFTDRFLIYFLVLLLSALIFLFQLMKMPLLTTLYTRISFYLFWMESIRTRQGIVMSLEFFYIRWFLTLFSYYQLCFFLILCLCFVARVLWKQFSIDSKLL